MISTIDLKEQLEQLKASYNSRLGEKKGIEEQIVSLDKSVLEDKVSIADFEAIGLVLQDTTDEARKVYSDNLALVVTSALQHTFGPDFRLIIEHKESRGKPEIHFYVEHELGNKIIKSSPEKSMGGGVVDIVAFALQVAVKKLCKEPAQNGCMILDEPAKMVSQNFAIKLGQFIQFISKEFDIQINGVTHQQYLADQASKCFDVNIYNGSSVVKEKIPVIAPVGP